MAPRIVGELLCQRNSYAKEFQTTVVSCVPHIPLVPENGSNKQSGGKKKGPTLPADSTVKSNEPLWEIELEDTVLFPEGGGQPTDHGVLIVDMGPEIPISRINRLGLRAVHFSPTPIEPGTRVTQRINETRRMDHMQQHTGQHLLSAVMEVYYKGLETLGWSMGASLFIGNQTESDDIPNMNYVELARKPTDEEVKDIQRRCNEIISKNLSITVDTPLDAITDHLPADYDAEKGVVRVITIDGLDKNPCCGTHLSQTSHVSLILLHHTQPIRSTNTRLYFTCGERAITLASASLSLLRLTSAELSSTPNETPSRASKLVKDLRDANRTRRKLENELAAMEAQRVVADLEKQGAAFVYRVSEDPAEYIASVIAAVPPEILKSKGAVVLVGAYPLPSPGGAPRGGGPVVVVGEPKAVDAIIAKMKDALPEGRVKGGGKSGTGRWQGKVNGAALSNKEADTLKATTA